MLNLRKRRPSVGLPDQNSWHWRTRAPTLPEGGVRPAIIWTVFAKEVVETLRDRRSLFMLVGMPILLYPLLILGLSKVVKTQTEARAARDSVVAVWGDAPAGITSADGTLDLRAWEGVPDDVRADLESGRLAPPAVEEVDASAAPSASTERREPDRLELAARAAIAGEAIDIVIVPWRGLDEALAKGELGRVTVFHDSVDEDSRQGRDRIEDALEAWRETLVKERLAARGLSPGYARGLDVHTLNVAPPERRSGQRLGAILPFLLIVMSLMGGFYASIDLTAGEKERGTMQTLLCAPVLPSEIIAGKFLTVWLMTLLAGLANVGSIALTLWRILPPDQLEIGPRVLVQAFLLFLPVSFTTSACFLAVGAFAKDFKDGQNFVTPVYLALSIPSSFTMLPGVELSAWTAFIPVLNIALLIKGLLLGEATPDLVFLTLVSAGLYAMLALLFAARVFQREQVLLGGQEPLLVTLGLERTPGQTPSPAMALCFFAVASVAVFYGSLAIESRGIVATLLLSQLGFFLLPSLVWVVAFGLAPVATLSLRPPPLRGVVAGLLVGASAWALVGGLVHYLQPQAPESLTEGLKKILLLGGEASSVWVGVLVIGVAPGVCEETMFRGLLLSGLRKLGPWRGVLLTALLFGLAHASVHRLMPTALLGVMFGYLVLRTGSIFTSIIAHALNNSLMVALVHDEALVARLGLADPAGALPPWVLLLGAAGTGLGLWLASTVTPPADAPSS
jgi:sodium transport system permease protein